MDKCPKCKGTKIGIFGSYYHCRSEGCGALLELVDPEHRKEEARRKSPEHKAEMLAEAH